MQEHENVGAIGAHRLGVFSDAVIAVIMTVMVLELKAPEQSEFAALWPLWHTVVSYAVSYLFIAIIWINHHYLLTLVGTPTLRLIWINFAHLFMVSFLPFATAWIARTQLASAPVVVYAAPRFRFDLRRLAPSLAAGFSRPALRHRGMMRACNPLRRRHARQARARRSTPTPRVAC